MSWPREGRSHDAAATTRAVAKSDALIDDISPHGELRRFIDDIDKVLLQSAGAPPDLGQLALPLARFLRSSLLQAAADAHLWRSEAYQRHRLAVAERSGAVVYAMAWLPEQATPIHNHGTWGVIGVAIGALREARYELDAAGCARPVGTRVIASGEIVSFADGVSAIHACAGAGSGRSLSIHLYGRDDALLTSFASAETDRIAADTSDA